MANYITAAKGGSNAHSSAKLIAIGQAEGSFFKTINLISHDAKLKSAFLLYLLIWRMGKQQVALNRPLKSVFKVG